MTIRSKFLTLLLPTFTAFLVLISLYFYFNWSKEIINSFRSRLLSTVALIAQTITPDEIEWLDKHMQDPLLLESPIYQSLRQRLINLRQQLPNENLYLVKIEPSPEDQDRIQNQSKNLTFRQVFLLDASDPHKGVINKPGEYDFSETDEHLVYLTKKPLVSSIYVSKSNQKKYLSGYAPIINTNKEVVALLGSDLGMFDIDRKLQNALTAIISGALATIFMVILTVFLIADRISKPVKQLNEAALEIAAGHYNTKITSEGPKEIKELANTFNIMTECLSENLYRLKESSIIREKMYGEYESSLLLQRCMLQQVVDEFKHPRLHLKLISIQCSGNQRGVLLKSSIHENGELNITLLETSDPGFPALFRLNQETFLPLDDLQTEGFVDCLFINDYQQVRCRNSKLPPPLIWSINSKQIITNQRNEFSLQERDLIFICNSGLYEHFKSEEPLIAWLSRVLRHFANDGLDTIQTMLTSELNFLAKRNSIKKNCHIIGLEVKRQ